MGKKEEQEASAKIAALITSINLNMCVIAHIQDEHGGHGIDSSICLAALMDRVGYCLAWCGPETFDQTVERMRETRDHYVALKKGGMN